MLLRSSCADRPFPWYRTLQLDKFARFTVPALSVFPTSHVLDECLMWRYAAAQVCDAVTVSTPFESAITLTAVRQLLMCHLPFFIGFCSLHSGLPRVGFSPSFAAAARGGRLRSIQRVPAIRGAAISGEGLGTNTASQATRNGTAEQVRETNGGLSTTELVLPRIGNVTRVTKETSVDVRLNLDGTGVCNCNTGIPFLDHMLDQLASHGLLDVEVTAKGDIHIDDHHTNEDIGLAVGTALLQALGDRKGIYRFGDFNAPLDEALVHVVLDLSGRPYLGYDVNIPTQRVGTYDTQLVEHFFQSVVNTSGMTLHIRQLAGKNSHHIIEATFKAFARALRQAIEYDLRRKGTIPSSKGVLSRA